MNPVSAIFDSLVLYRYPLILALAAAAGVCVFMACCSHTQISIRCASSTALLAVLGSLVFSRLIYWYGRPDSFSSPALALTSSSAEAHALAGAFAGCILAVLCGASRADRIKMLDSLPVAGCVSIALGRLAFFFTDADRGQIMTRLTSLPWAYPVANASGQPEYRFATFLFQAAAAAVLGIILAVIFFRRKHHPGDIAILFVLCYSASQVLLDSTRYDSLYLRSNGFISIVQVLSAAVLVITLLFLSLQAVKNLRRKSLIIPLWVGLSGLIGGVGYMEYYVQRHGRNAAFGYSIMALCLCCIAGLGIWLLKLSHKSAHT